MGQGRLTLKSGGYYEGYWSKGILIEGGYFFADGLPYSKIGQKQWDYCSQHDPRFYSEIREGIAKGTTLKHLTSHKHVDALPKACYDVIEGYFDPKSKAIYDYESGGTVREPSQEEIEWIKANCRVAK